MRITAVQMTLGSAGINTYVKYAYYFICVISLISIKTNLPRIPNLLFNDIVQKKAKVENNIISMMSPTSFCRRKR